MIPEPSKRPFGYPLTAEALAYFCHPTAPGFTGPVRMGEYVYAAGAVALRVDPAAVVMEEAPEAGERFKERVGGLPWDRFELLDRKEMEKSWATMHDAALGLWKFGPRTMWGNSGSKVYLRDNPKSNPWVRIGSAAMAPLSMVQLCSRLPRAKVVVSNRVGDAILVSFNGGQAIIPALKPYATDPSSARFTILRPREDDRMGSFFGR